MQRRPSHQPIRHNNPHQDSNPLSPLVGTVAVRLQNARSRNAALALEFGRVHAVAPVTAGVRRMLELIHHHALEYICLPSLCISVCTVDMLSFNGK